MWHFLISSLHTKWGIRKTDLSDFKSAPWIQHNRRLRLTSTSVVVCFFLWKTTLRRQTSPNHPPPWCTRGETWSTGWCIAGCCGHIPGSQEFQGRWRCRPAGRCLSWGGHTPGQKGKKAVIVGGSRVSSVTNRAAKKDIASILTVRDMRHHCTF